MKTIYIISIIFASILLGAVWQRETTPSPDYKAKIETVLYTCRRSHAVVDHALERRCDELQDQTGTTFSCKNDACWLVAS